MSRVLWMGKDVHFKYKKIKKKQQLTVSGMNYQQEKLWPKIYHLTGQVTTEQKFDIS